VVWNISYFSIQLGIIIPTDELIFFRGVAQPPTRSISNTASLIFLRISSHGKTKPAGVWWRRAGSLGGIAQTSGEDAQCAECQAGNCTMVQHMLETNRIASGRQQRPLLLVKSVDQIWTGQAGIHVTDFEERWGVLALKCL